MISTGASLLSEARIEHARIPQLPPAARPMTMEEAYDCQAEVVVRWLEHYGGTVSGYKVACTNVAAQEQLHVDGPFFGHLLSAFCLESPARLETAPFFMRVVEAEFAFQIGRDLPPSGTPRSQEEVAEAVEGVIPGIELVDSRFDNWTEMGALSLIADNACHAAWVRGPLRKGWRSIDLAAQKVRVEVNGAVVREGSGAAVLGGPLNVLTWLVNRLASRGIGLEAGQYVTTGVTTDVYYAERGTGSLWISDQLARFSWSLRRAGEQSGHGDSGFGRHT